MKSIRGGFLLPLFAGVLALGACEDGTGSGGGRVSVRLVDAPGDFKEARVQITGLYLQRESESDSTSGRLDLAVDTATYFDLLTLTNGNAADLVRDAVIPAGTYNILRVVVGNAYVITKDGTVYATPGAVLPSGLKATGTINRTRGKSSGYQVKFPGSGLVVENDTKVLALDFDVARSFGHVAGNSRQLILHPAFNVTQVTLAAGIRGTVSSTGVTFPTCGGAATDVSHFVATATAGTTTVTAKAGTDGKYAMPFVAPGTYSMGVAPIAYTNGDTLTFTATAMPNPVTVASGATAVSDYSVTAAACKVKPAG